MNFGGVLGLLLVFYPKSGAEKVNPATVKNLSRGRNHQISNLLTPNPILNDPVTHKILKL